MKTFDYLAKDASGKSITGKVEAKDALTAARLIRERNLVPIKITPERETPLTLINKVQSRVRFKDLVTFTRQFATMITAGLPLTDALVILRNQSSPGMRQVAGEILLDIQSGTSLASAMKKHPTVFSEVYIALIAAGETGGVLDNVLLRLAENLEKEQEFKSKVKGAMIYPIIVVIGMFIVAAIMMIFVVPRMVAIYKDFGADLPAATKLLIAISDITSGFWWIFALVVAGAVWFYWIFKNTPGGARKIDSWKLRIPILGKLLEQIILTELARTLGLLVGAGVSLLEGLKVVSGVVGNKIYSEGIDGAAKEVEKGFPLATALAQQPEIFPPVLTQMLAVGEETGNMAEVLEKTAHIFEIESEQSVKTLTAAIEPLIMVFLGIGVGFLVIAIVLPIYNLTGQF